eukprot:7523858-Pyramimonas_sp.AAC.1
MGIRGPCGRRLEPSRGPVGGISGPRRGALGASWAVGRAHPPVFAEALFGPSSGPVFDCKTPPCRQVYEALEARADAGVGLWRGGFVHGEP